MIEPGIYKLKEEFFVLNNIAINQWKSRKDDLLQWISNFFDYELLNGKPLQIKIIEVYGEYQPLPRKVPETNMKEKIEDYEKFTIAALGNEFKPNSKSKVAREAIDSFAYKKYGHTSQRAVTERFVKPAFDKYGETDNSHIWVWYSTYEELSEEDLATWRMIMESENISEMAASSAFYRYAQGENVDEEVGYFTKARQRFKEIYGEAPILVSKWRLKR